MKIFSFLQVIGVLLLQKKRGAFSLLGSSLTIPLTLATITLTAVTGQTISTPTELGACPILQLPNLLPDVLITATSGQPLLDLSSAFGDYLCRLKAKILSLPGFPSGRRLESYSDPSVVVIRAELVYNPNYFYQSIIYKKDDQYFYQLVNTGLTMATSRLLQSSTGGQSAYNVFDFPSREHDFQKLMDLLKNKPIIQGMVTTNFANLYQYVSGLSGTFGSNAVQVTAQNAGDLFGVCGGTNCHPSP